MKAAGIKTRGRVLDIQALRHTYNTLLRKILPEEMLRLQIGHKSVSMTDNYDQATPMERLRAFKWHQPQNASDAKTTTASHFPPQGSGPSA